MIPAYSSKFLLFLPWSCFTHRIYEPVAILQFTEIIVQTRSSPYPSIFGFALNSLLPLPPHSPSPTTNITNTRHKSATRRSLWVYLIAHLSFFQPFSSFLPTYHNLPKHRPHHNKYFNNHTHNYSSQYQTILSIIANILNFTSHITPDITITITTHLTRLLFLYPSHLYPTQFHNGARTSLDLLP